MIIFKVDIAEQNRILTMMNNFDFETGAIFGAADRGSDNYREICLYQFDPGVASSRGEYFPNIPLLNSVIKDWTKKSIQFQGILHSHRERSRLSYADVDYASRVCSINKLNGILMPIYVLDFKMYWYWVDKDKCVISLNMNNQGFLVSTKNQECFPK